MAPHRKRGGGGAPRVLTSGQAELRAIRLALEQRLAHAIKLGQIPDRDPRFRHRRWRIRYEVYVSRDRRTGQVSANVNVSSFEWLLIPRPHTASAIQDWLISDGLALVAKVDQALDRQDFDPPLAGKTLLMAEMPAEDDPSMERNTT